MTQQGQSNGYEYLTQAGDTLLSIAQRAYNNSSQPYWTAIYRMNQGQVGDDPNAPIKPQIGIFIPFFAASPQIDRFYIVQGGDTLSNIAQQAYNNGSQLYWTTIYLVNQYEIGNDPNVITSGEPLYIPRIASPPQGGRTFYFVKAGDTLWGIAQQAYNDGSQSQIIYDDNLKVIGKDPNLIVPGQILYIRDESEIGGGGGGGNIHFPVNPTWSQI